MTRTYCTYFDSNYLMKGLALIESLNQRETSPFRLFVVCLDGQTQSILEKLDHPNVVPVPLQRIEQGDEALCSARGNRSLVEYYWTLTPTVILRFLEEVPPGDSVTYLDADLFFYSSPEPIFSEFVGHSVLIHGHRFPPSLKHLDEYGKYNVGLLCFRRDESSLEVLSWWRDRCNEWCYARAEDGKFGDQLYLDDWPERFSGVHVLEHVGAGVAPWNHEQYAYGVDAFGTALVDGWPLIFYHFHSFFFVTEGIVVPAKIPAYPMREEVVRLCVAPYLDSLIRGMAAIRKIVPDFCSGLENKNVLGPDLTFVARNELAPAIRNIGINHPTFDLGNGWECHASRQMTYPGVQPRTTYLFPESALAHKWLDGLKGLEIGPSAHNPFGLNTRNVGIRDEIYENEQLSLVGEAARLDIVARADDIPLPDESEDFILSSHVIEHCPDLIKTLVEWYRIVKCGGYIFMIVPHRYAAPSDRGRSLTDWPHILVDFQKSTTDLTEPEAGKFGHCHYHVFSPETMRDFIGRIFGSRLMLVDFQEFDDKLGNGFTLVYRKEIPNSASLPWDYVSHWKVPILNASHGIVVSAIVSTYNAEHFMRGCLEDLTGQTLFANGGMEIVVVDSASPQNEAAIVREFQALHGDRIIYIRTDVRESIYQAWNRAIRAARGRYITNANTDDRHRSDALEILAQELDSHPDVALAYADVFVTNLDNQAFDSHIRCGYHLRPDYMPEIMLSGCHMGPQPMWRKSIHDEIGYFSEDLRSAADYEFWCRTALRHQLLHIPEFLGLYYENPAGFCNADMGLSRKETAAILNTYAGHFSPPLRNYTNNLQYRGNASTRHYVNICMVTYNRLEFTSQAINALVLHTDFPYVLTVIDNASSDGTREYLLEQKRMGVIKNLVLLNENVGVAKASNLAWSLEPEAAYYLKLDNDIVIQKPGWLWEMIRVIEAVTEAGAVGYNFETTSYEAATAYGVQFRPKSNGNLGGACILIPRRTHDLLGYWCEDYGLYGEEDADYGARIRTAGLYNLYMEDELIGLHLPAGRAAIIDHTFTARDGYEENMHAEYRAWKDEARRLNVLSGRYIRNVEGYAQKGSAVYLDSAFVRAWHDKQSMQADENCHTIGDTQSDSTKQAGCGTGGAPVTMHSAKTKIGIFGSAPLVCACPALRLVSPLTYLHETEGLEAVNIATLLETAPESLEDELKSMSALVLQRSKIAFWPYRDFGPFLERTRTRLILEVDDAMMHAPETNPQYAFFQSMQHEFEEYFRHADLITVSTPYLKELYSHYNPNVVVLPNCIDTTIWPCEPPAQSTTEGLPIKILFSGTPSHVEDFRVLSTAIKRILEEFPQAVELIIWGNMIPEFAGHPSVRLIEQYVDNYASYAATLATLKADIGIIPLQDTVFNRAKSAIKWLEYSACGIAGIFSNVGEYGDVMRHGKTGLMVENNDADWYAAIKELIVNRQLRSSIAREAYNDVMSGYTVAHNAHKWLEAYKVSGCI